MLEYLDFSRQANSLRLFFVDPFNIEVNLLTNTNVGTVQMVVNWPVSSVVDFGTQLGHWLTFIDDNLIRALIGQNFIVYIVDNLVPRAWVRD